MILRVFVSIRRQSREPASSSLVEARQALKEPNTFVRSDFSEIVDLIR